jgi:hypothetical protein
MSLPAGTIRAAMWVAGYLASFAIAATSGFYAGASALHGKAIQTNASDRDRRAANMERHLALRLDPSRVDTLTAYLAQLDRDNPGALGEFASYAAAERALTLARLAAAERTQGDEQAARAFMGQALALCPVLKWTQCNEDQLADGAIAMDRKAFPGGSLPGH